MGRRAGCWLAGALFIVVVFAQDAAASVLVGVALKPEPEYLELHFQVRGPAPRWTLEAQRQLLTITLQQTRIAIRRLARADSLPAPLTGLEVAEIGGAGRIVMAVAGRVDYAATFGGQELIVRLARSGAAPHLAAPIRVATARRPPAPMPEVASGPSLGNGMPAPAGAQVAAFVPPMPRHEPVSPQAAPHRVVVIDPGHGGRDPGTESAGGVAEKDVALRIALLTHDALEARGISEPLTRSDDRFLTLAERTQFANRMNADLFVSIHLNSSPDPRTSGIEVYYLNNTTDRATMRLAAMENGGVGGYGTSGKANLDYILDDLTQGEKAHESVALAQKIETDSAAQVAAATGLRMNLLGVKRGPFYVLVGAEMPAVLVECGFLSNAAEADRLTDPRYQQGLADGIADAVVRYLDNYTAVGNL